MSNGWRPAAEEPWAGQQGSNLRQVDAEWNAHESALRGNVSTAHASVSLTDAPATRVFLQVMGTPLLAEGLRTVTRLVRLTLPPKCHYLELHVEPGHLAELALEGEVQRRLRIEVRAPHDAPRPRLVLGASGVLATLKVTECNLELNRKLDAEQRFSPPLYMSRLVCQDAGLQYLAGHAGRVDVSGRCDVELEDCRKTAVQVNPGAALRLRTTGEVASIKVREPNRIDARDLEGFTLRGGTKVEAPSISGLRLRLEADADLKVGTINSCAIAGPGRIEVTEQGHGLQFESPAPTLITKRHTQVRQASGPVVLFPGGHELLAGKAGTDLRGSEEPLTLEGLDVDDGRPVDGLSITNVRIPVTRNGLRTIALLSGAANVEPLIHPGLPGRSQLFRPKAKGDLQLQAEYGRALSDLARAKGAPASTRTTLAACAYRLRQRTCGPIERCVLRLYGLLGYGEIFLPPALTFLAVAGVLTCVGLAHDGYPSPELSGDALGRWLQTFGDWLTSPLHLLRLTEPTAAGSSFSEPWNALARLVVAIPFTVATLALRNFVKDDHRSRT